MSAQLAKIAADLPTGPDAFDDEGSPEVRLLATKAAIERLAHGTMLYRCKDCGYEARIWLSLGVEGPEQLRDAGLYLPCPFIVRCLAWIYEPAADPLQQYRPCEGEMPHVEWQRDERFEPRLIPDDALRFVLPRGVWRGDHGGELEVPEPALVAARRWHRDQYDREGGFS